MKFNLKSFICGIIAATTLFTATAIARDIYENISVVRNSLEVTIDGDKFDYDNFVYNGTTYVPLRAISETLGFGVEYDDQAYKANIVRDCSYKFIGDVVGTINGYQVTDTMYEAYKNNIVATRPELSESELDAVVKQEIKNNVYMIQIANALDIYIDSSFNSNYVNLVKFMEIQFGGAEEFVKDLRSKGISDEMYRHLQEISQLKNDVLHFGEISALTEQEQELFLSEIFAELDKESVIEWYK